MLATRVDSVSQARLLHVQVALTEAPGQLVEWFLSDSGRRPMRSGSIYQYRRQPSRQPRGTTLQPEAKAWFCLEVTGIRRDVQGWFLGSDQGRRQKKLRPPKPPRLGLDLFEFPEGFCTFQGQGLSNGALIWRIWLGTSFILLSFFCQFGFLVFPETWPE